MTPTRSLALAPTSFPARVRQTLRAMRERRLASVSMLASLVVPGLGSVANGDLLRGAGFLTGFALSALLLGPVFEVIAMFAFWLMSLVDAYEGAQD